MSNQDVNGAIERGRSQLTGRLTEALGRTFLFPNKASLTASGFRDGRLSRMMVVKNGEASAALVPGSLVTWKAGAFGTTVVLPAATAGVLIAGVVDYLLPAAGAAAGYDFLITIWGPCKYLYDANAIVAEYDNLLNSGSVAGTARTGTHNAAGTVGRAEVAALAGGGALATATTSYGYFGGVSA